MLSRGEREECGTGKLQKIASGHAHLNILAEFQFGLLLQKSIMGTRAWPRPGTPLLRWIVLYRLKVGFRRLAEAERG
jgi:predicted transcriptional regulator